ncbi:MAG: hypothetical protein ACE5KK_00205 [Candidatus Brocadiales bacterium]
MVTISDNLHRIKLTHQPDATSETAELELGSLGGYKPGDSIQVSVGGELREFLVDGISNELSTRGWTQRLSVLSPMWLEGKKSPKKKQIFLTLSQAQYDEFQKDYAGRDTGLEYHPLIRLGDEYGEGGWDSNQIMEALGRLAGVTVHSSLPAYWVKQFSVEPDTPILSAINNLVSPMEPFIYSLGGRLFITEGGGFEDDFGTGNRLDLSDVRMVREEVIRAEKPTQIRLLGNLGRFRPQRFKGPIASAPYQRVWEKVGSRWVWNHTYGTERELFFTEVSSLNTPTRIGSNMSPVSVTSGTRILSYFAPDPQSVTYDPDTFIVNGYSLEEVSTLRGKDVFGNTSHTLSESRSTYKYRLIDSGAAQWVGRVLYSRAKTAYLYENTHWSFTVPREYGNIVGNTFITTPGRINSLDQMVFYPSDGQVVFGLFENIEETLTYYWYTPEGELAGHSTSTTGVVYTDDDVTFRELKFMEKDDLSPNGTLLRDITREEVVSYTQISRDSYSMRRVVSRLGLDGRYHTDVDMQIVQAGAVQGAPAELRRMEVYAEMGAASMGSASDTMAVMNTPSRELSINTPSWESLENILPFLEKRYGKDEVLRTYEVLGELNVHVGLQVDMKSVSNLDGSEQIPAPALDPDFIPIVVGYNIEKDITSGKVTTTLIVRGRLQ